jgi:hypothetical protein
MKKSNLLKLISSLLLLTLANQLLAAQYEDDYEPIDETIEVIGNKLEDELLPGGGFFYGGSSSPPRSGGSNTQNEKDTEKEFKENVGVAYSTCRAYTSANYASALKSQCLGGGQFTIGSNGLISGSVTLDAYNQCKDLQEAYRDNGYDSCAVVKAVRIKAC